MTIDIYLKGILLLFLAFSAWRDIKEQRIPNEYIIRGVAIRILLLLHEIATIGTAAIRNIIFKMFICLVILIIGMLVRKVTKDGVGMGDIKLLALMFLYLNIDVWMNALICGLLCGLVHGVIVRVRFKEIKQIPFAPSLFLGTLIAIVFA